MIDQGLAQQLASVLAPFLPFLAVPTVAAGKDAAMKALGGKFADASWEKATCMWKKLWPEVQKKPETAKALKKLAEKGSDPRVEAALSIELEELDLSPKVFEEIRSIISEKSLEIRKVSADNGSIAIGGDVQGSTINMLGPTLRYESKKARLEMRVDKNRIYIHNRGPAEATDIKVFINNIPEEANAWDGFAQGDLPFRKSLKPGQETHRLWSGPCFGGPRAISYKITWINEDKTSGLLEEEDFRLF